ncbi:DUF5686 and carboxypeptidase regulatory-like domain-containing protein [Lewinella sp. JB7]|uniref:DUF5686 and carboxypeptidase regulatory-like domain-containing protein n=1 Tax=Lewinella sp. JB7 TaxID=2962887 RepID=UPI0020C9823C|nr:DUF5686 and carboxypeptidase regulatory-like domain-containing protein [Lewinella sp. JB7]MCP9237481.1 DUF5686 and carboxypeptidase regulatory-like domain-containing protein [Lewinella sp. JB7]
MIAARCTLSFLLVLLTALGTAQTLTGRVTDEATGEALPYTSIYVQQTGTGATTNTEGRYELNLRPGKNTIIFQFLGYQTQVREVESGRGSLDVQLRTEALDLDQVEVLSGAEDLSYSVIRRAIAKADYHRNQVDRYTADVYLKGKGKVDKIPKLYQKLVPKEERREVTEIIGKDFTSETTSRITYERPATFTEEVLSKYVVGEEDFSVSGYIFSSFYQPEVAGVVSPLSPKSFAYYRFEHEGVFMDQGKLINKIQVIPRSRGEDVFEGYVYIVQDDWSLHSLDLRTYGMGFTVDLKINYNEVADRIWMPTTTTISGRGGILGIKISASYIASTSNYDIELNPDLGGYVEVIDEQTQPEVAAATRRENQTAGYEETLESGGELTRKELMKLMRNYERDEREKTGEPEVVGNYTFKDDSVKTIRDSAAWEAVRPIPLTQEEIAGYRYQDSVARVARLDSIAEARGEDLPSEQRAGRKRLPPALRFDVAPDLVFNPVEGYAVGAKLTKNLRRTVVEDTSSHQEKFGELSLRTRYGFAWKRASWELEYRNWTGKREKGEYYFSGGRYLRQFDPAPAIDPVLNSFTALLYGDNYARFYERAYATAGYRKRFSDAFKIGTSATFEDRRTVSNHTNHRWWGEDDFAYAPNRPFNAERGEIDRVADAALIDVRAAWRPGLKYFIRNGRKRLIENSAPTLGFYLQAGLPGLSGSASDFTLVETSYRHRFAAGRKGAVNLLVRGGAFLNNAYVDFPDFRHFATSEIFLTRLDPIGSYRLLPYYRNSTAEEYLEVYAHYQFRKLLFTNIWQLHLMGLKEDLFVNYLYTPTSEHYTEVGYSLDNLLRVLRLEFVTAFRDGRYDDFGVRLSFTTTFGGGDDVADEF